MHNQILLHDLIQEIIYSKQSKVNANSLDGKHLCPLCCAHKNLEYTFVLCRLN
jgi:hypothetical protein